MEVEEDGLIQICPSSMASTLVRRLTDIANITAQTHKHMQKQCGVIFCHKVNCQTINLCLLQPAYVFVSTFGNNQACCVNSGCVLHFPCAGVCKCMGKAPYVSKFCNLPECHHGLLLIWLGKEA